MYPHGHHRHFAHTRRHNHRRSNVGNGDQSVLHQYAGSHGSAPGDDIAGTSTLQSHDPQPFQQSATQLTSNESFVDPTILEHGNSHAWLRQQQQLWSRGDLAPATDHTRSNYQMDAHGAPGVGHTHQRYSLDQFGAPMSMMNNQSGNRSMPSTTCNGPVDSSAPIPGYFHRPDAIADSRIMEEASMAGHNYFHQPPSVGLGQLGMGGVDMARLNVDPELPPWSPYDTTDVYTSPYHVDAASLPDWHDTAEMTSSTTDHDGSGSGRISQSYTPLSSTGYVDESMMDSGVTERPVVGYPQNMDVEQISPYSPTAFLVPQIDIRNHVAQMDAPLSMGDSSRCEDNLLVPMQRSHSTRSSVSNASSAGGPPPTNDPDIMCCEVADCRQPFTGTYRRGNLGRHRRLVHGAGKPYVCEDGTCAKEFRRQDARLKHYRKYHPELAADSPLVRRSSASRPTRRNQDVEFSNMSGWAT